jgi:hypothetical protein
MSRVADKLKGEYAGTRATEGRFCGTTLYLYNNNDEIVAILDVSDIIEMAMQKHNEGT